LQYHLAGCHKAVAALMESAGGNQFDLSLLAQNRPSSCHNKRCMIGLDNPVQQHGSFFLSMNPRQTGNEKENMKK